MDSREPRRGRPRAERAGGRRAPSGSWCALSGSASRCSSHTRLSRRRQTACRSFSMSRYVPARMNAPWCACRPSFSCRTLPVRIACAAAAPSVAYLRSASSLSAQRVQSICAARLPRQRVRMSRPVL